MNFREKIKERIEVLHKVCENEELIKKIIELVYSHIKKGAKIILCGNGGSASDSSHIAAEFIGKIKDKTKKPIPAINIGIDAAVITAIANDYGFEEIFSKQIEAIGKKNDILIIFSTSGKSKNVSKAILKAKEIGLKIIYFTGENSPINEELCDFVIKLPTSQKEIIQEVYMILWHIIVEKIEEKL
ncbi:MAG: SIS domain-containing protein [candidate division WOR-3 bacterium]